jgi:LPS export ABC transporter protein LptC
MNFNCTYKINKNKTVSSKLLTVLFFVLACTSNKPEEIKAIEELQNTPSLAIENFESVITDSGKVKYHITTPQLLNYDKKADPYVEYPKGGHIITYDSINVINSQIKCRYAIYYEKDQLWDLRSDVEAVNEDGIVFNTEQLYWNQKKEEIYTDERIKITTKDEIITGHGFTSTQNLKQYRIKNISAIISIDE